MSSVNQSAPYFSLVQISDSHLFAEADGKLLGLNTQYSLDLTLQLVSERNPSPEFLVATGDVSQDASLLSYERFQSMLMDWQAQQQIKTQLYWLPGNHDHPDVMSQVLPDAGLTPFILDHDRWRIIGLDSRKANEVSGWLADDQLAFLTSACKQCADRHIFIFLHHHPVGINSDWLDRLALRNSDALWACVDACPSVRGIAWGHVHQSFESERNGVRLFATPSTCVQFKPRSRQFSIDEESPGYRWFQFFDDGHIETGVERVTGVTFEVDYSVKGY